MYSTIPIIDLIPQRPPFVMVDRLVAFESTAAKTQFLVKPDCILCQNGHLSEAGMMENLAQTCAAYIGYRNREQEVKIGVIGAIKNFEIIDMPKIGATIESTIRVVADVFGMLLVNGCITSAGRVISTCEMKISLLD